MSEYFTSEKSEQAIQHIASALSHDVRTPVRHINHFADFLEQELGDMPDSAKEHLEAVRLGLGEINELLGTLVEYARLSQLDEAPEAFRLSAALEEAMARTRLTLNATDATLHVSGDAELTAHKPLIISLFMYLIENAIMFSPAERPSLIQASIQKTTKGVDITVEDNGEGIAISPQSAFRLFQKGKVIGEPQGLGTGLAFSKRIAEIHGGDVQLEAEPGALGGAAFRVSLAVENA